jgi:hypothetical protein
MTLLHARDYTAFLSGERRCSSLIGSITRRQHTRGNLAYGVDADARQVGERTELLRTSDETSWDAGFRRGGGARRGGLRVGNASDRKNSSESLCDHLERIEMDERGS